MKAVKLDNISFSYQKQKSTLFENFHLGFNRGEFSFILGANGSGKSTLLGLITGSLTPKSGQVLYEGTPVTNSKKRSALIGYVPQGTNLDGEMSVSDTLDFIGSCHFIPQPILQERKIKIARALGLNDFISRRIRFLSGGQKQRVNISLALLHDPEIILLDEPFVGLDYYSVSGILSELMHLNKTIICVTHDVDIAETHAQTVILLKDGKILEQGNPAEIIGRSPFHLHEVDFKSNIPKERPEQLGIHYSCLHNRMVISYPNQPHYHATIEGFLKEHSGQIRNVSSSVNTLKAGMVGLHHLNISLREKLQEHNTSKGKGGGRGDGSGGGKQKHRNDS